jgi:hypothetical protein
MLSEEHLTYIRGLLGEKKYTEGPWYSSPTDRTRTPGGTVRTGSGELILDAPNLYDALMATSAKAFLAELVEEVTALRALPGDHYQKAGLHRQLTNHKELKALPVGSIVENRQGTWSSILDGKVVRWLNTKNPEHRLTTGSMLHSNTVLHEPAGN